jgi:hypothetical protein
MASRSVMAISLVIVRKAKLKGREQFASSV